MRDHIRLRNAVTELWNQGVSVPQMAYMLGKDEATVLAYVQCAREGFHTPRQRAESESGAVSDSKPSDPLSGVIPRPEAKDRLERRTEALERTCAVCGQPVLPTGKRGRPRTVHIECREDTK